MTANRPEVWLRGPLPGIPPLVQPVAHALLQAREEVDAEMKDFPEGRLWERPAGVASVGFHLQHLAGVLDRLFTYANASGLSDAQLETLAAEGKSGPALEELLSNFHHAVDVAIHRLGAVDETTLTQPRAVGRGQLPSTVLGLLVHSAEHTMRHVGQLLVTARVLRQG